MQVRFTWSQN